MKTEPISYDDINLPQLDGQTDILSDDSLNPIKKEKELIANTSSTSTKNKKKSSNRIVHQQCTSEGHLMPTEEKLKNKSNDDRIQKQAFSMNISKYFKVNYLYPIIKI